MNWDGPCDEMYRPIDSEGAVRQERRPIRSGSMEQEVYRHVPYDIEVEQALLGSILVDNQALERVSATLKPEHFYDPLHQRLYEAMSLQFEKGGMVITPLTLHAAMKADAGLQE